MLVTNKVHRMTWPHSVIIQFDAVEPDTTVKTEWYAPYNMLLQHVFKYEDGFGVHPQYSLFESWECIDFTMIYIVERNQHWFLSLRSSHVSISSISPDILVQMCRSTNVLQSSDVILSSLDYTQSQSWGQCLPPTNWKRLAGA